VGKNILEIKKLKQSIEKNKQCLAESTEEDHLSLLLRLKKISKLVKSTYRMFIVQPAISKTKASAELLSIIGSAETYIKETSGINLEVIISD